MNTAPISQGAFEAQLETAASELETEWMDPGLRRRWRESEIDIAAAKLESELTPSGSAAELETAAADLARELGAHESGAEQIFSWWRRRKAPTRPSWPSPQASRLRRMVRMSAPRGGPYSTIWRPPRHQVIAEARAAAARLRIARNRMGQARQALNQAEEAMNHEIRMSFGDFKQIDPDVQKRLSRAREEFQAAEVELRAAEDAFNRAMQQRSSRVWQT